MRPRRNGAVCPPRVDLHGPCTSWHIGQIVLFIDSSQASADAAAPLQHEHHRVLRVRVRRLPTAYRQANDRHSSDRGHAIRLGKTATTSAPRQYTAAGRGPHLDGHRSSSRNGRHGGRPTCERIQMAGGESSSSRPPRGPPPTTDLRSGSRRCCPTPTRRRPSPQSPRAAAIAEDVQPTATEACSSSAASCRCSWPGLSRVRPAPSTECWPTPRDSSPKSSHRARPPGARSRPSFARRCAPARARVRSARSPMPRGLRGRRLVETDIIRVDACRGTGNRAGTRGSRARSPSRSEDHNHGVWLRDATVARPTPTASPRRRSTGPTRRAAPRSDRPRRSNAGRRAHRPARTPSSAPGIEGAFLYTRRAELPIELSARRGPRRGRVRASSELADGRAEPKVAYHTVAARYAAAQEIATKAWLLARSIPG